METGLAGKVASKHSLPVWIAASATIAIAMAGYGWDVSLMLMMFALAIWLLLVGMQSGRIFYSYCSGIAAGVSLYSYLGARIAVISLASFIALECAARRERAMYRQAVAFLVGLLIAAYPFFCYYLSAPAEFWAGPEHRKSASSIMSIRFGWS